MAYALGWRIAMAKDLLHREKMGVAQVAEQVGYSSASTFSFAFARSVGMPPIRDLRRLQPNPGALRSAMRAAEALPDG